MDRSLEYIKMCEKAEEIQRIYQNVQKASMRISDSDFDRDAVWITYNGDFLFKFIKPLLIGEETIWLPRQDQLQEMIGNSCYWKLEYYRRGKRLNEHQPYEITIANGKHIYCIQGKTLEQLWLAFVMRERYGKIWLNGEWVNE